MSIVFWCFTALWIIYCICRRRNWRNLLHPHSNNTQQWEIKGPGVGIIVHNYKDIFFLSSLNLPLFHLSPCTGLSLISHKELYTLTLRAWPCRGCFLSTQIVPRLISAILILIKLPSVQRAPDSLSDTEETGRDLMENLPDFGRSYQPQS